LDTLINLVTYILTNNSFVAAYFISEVCDANMMSKNASVLLIVSYDMIW